MQNRKYDVNSDELHEFITNFHSFKDEYSTLYSKLYILDCVIERLDTIDLDDTDSVNIFTDCIFRLFKDTFSLADNLYSKSKNININSFLGVKNGRE